LLPDSGSLLLFLAAALVIAVTPGPGIFYVAARTLSGGRAEGLASILGTALGGMVHVIAGAAGVSALVMASAEAFTLLKLAGAAYLVFLGAQTLWHVSSGRYPRAGAAGRTLPPRAALRQGLVSNLGNPKMAAFFTSLLPQFGDGFAVLLGLGLVFSLMTLAWLSGYAFAVAKTSAFLLRPRVRRALDAITGAVLVAFGLRLAADRG